MSKIYGWLPDEIDNIDLEILFDYLSVEDAAEEEQQGVYIDEIMP